MLLVKIILKWIAEAVQKSSYCNINDYYYFIDPSTNIILKKF